MTATGGVMPENGGSKSLEPGRIEIPSLLITLLGARTQTGAGHDDLERLGSGQLVEDPCLLAGPEHGWIARLRRGPVESSVGHDDPNATRGSHTAVNPAPGSPGARQVLEEQGSG